MGYTRKKDSMGIIPLICGIAAGAGVLIAGTALMANTVSSKGEYTITGIGVPATCILAGFLDGITAGSVKSENRFARAMIAGGVLIFALLVIAVFGFGGLKSGIWKNLGAIAAGALMAGWICRKGKGRPKHRK